MVRITVKGSYDFLVASVRTSGKIKQTFNLPKRHFLVDGD